MTPAATGAQPDALAALIRDHFGDDTRPLGVAVSGGSDSLALLHLLHDWNGAPLRCVTVDHALRAEAAGEAAQVARLCGDLGIAHDTLKWTGWDGQGNLPAEARRARYALMADWAARHGLDGIALGHTADDVAETLLMRLARRAGIDGLAAMPARRPEAGITLHRPLLDARRADLRAWLKARGIAWIDDPSNADARYRRVQARRALDALAPVGVTVEALAGVAGYIAEARETLGHYALAEARGMIRLDAGDLLLDAAPFGALRPDIARRILQAGLRWIAGAEYGARGPDLTRVLASLAQAVGCTLAGVRITAEGAQIRLTREYAAIAGHSVSQDALWDGRWRIDGPHPPGATIAALGPEGRAACPDWRLGGLPAHSVEASPALWQGGDLLSAPLAGRGGAWSARLCRNEDDLHAMLLSH